MDALIDEVEAIADEIRVAFNRLIVVLVVLGGGLVLVSMAGC